MTNKEIERRFVCMDLPLEVFDSRYIDIRQGYIIAGSEKQIRLRSEDNNIHTLTIKSGNGLIRNEVDIELSKEQFVKMWPFTKELRLEKRRYFYRINSYTVEVDVYENELNKFITAEIEFNSISESKKFKPLPFMISEITDLEMLKSANLEEYCVPNEFLKFL